jgi:hypothetical protein
MGGVMILFKCVFGQTMYFQEDIKRKSKGQGGTTMSDLLKRTICSGIAHGNLLGSLFMVSCMIT